MTVMDSSLIGQGDAKQRRSIRRRLWGDQVNGHSQRNLYSGASSSEESPRDQYDYYHHQHNAYHLHSIRDGLFFRAFAKALFHRRRLLVDPDKKLFFPYEPGKQATSAVRMKNICHSNIAFKFLTTAPKSCFMRPPCGILLPGESIVATVVKHIRRPQQACMKQARDKFKIITLKLLTGVELTPELFDEQKDRVIVEQILDVHFLDPNDPTSELEKLKLRLAEADAANEACIRTLEKAPAQSIEPVNVLEEWNKMKLARHKAKEGFK